MNKFAPIALLATVLTFAVAPAALRAAEGAAPATSTAAVSVTAGKMIYGANGQRLAAVYRVTEAGAVQVILDGKLVTVPASSLSEVNGKVTTSLSKAELRRM